MFHSTHHFPDGSLLNGFTTKINYATNATHFVSDWGLGIGDWGIFIL